MQGKETTMQTKISEENSKLGKIPNVSLTPVKSCINCSHCAKDCYALKSYRMFPNVRNAWDSNLELVKNDPKNFFGAIDDYLTKKKPKFFRWHVAGDILDQKYLNNMIYLAIKHTETKFLAFTKNFKLNYAKVPSNLSIVFSMWVGMRKPRHKKGVSGFAWYQDGNEKRVPKTAIECAGHCDSCGMCFDIAKIGGHVVLYKH
jgi:ferredoxin